MVKDALYMLLTDGELKKAEGVDWSKSIRYHLDSGTLVYAQEQQKAMSLKKYVKDIGFMATSAFGYAPWVVGKLPLTLRPLREYRLEFSPASFLIVAAAQRVQPADTFQGFSVGYDNKTHQIQPLSWALVNVKGNASVPADGGREL